MSDRHEAAHRPAFGCLGISLLLAGIVGYILAADEGHWSEGAIEGRDCKAFEAGDNCLQYSVSSHDYVPHGGYAWLGWSALIACAAGVVLVVAAVVRLGGIRGLRRYLTPPQ